MQLTKKWMMLRYTDNQELLLYHHKKRKKNAVLILSKNKSMMQYSSQSDLANYFRKYSNVLLGNQITCFKINRWKNKHLLRAVLSEHFIRIFVIVFFNSCPTEEWSGTQIWWRPWSYRTWWSTPSRPSLQLRPGRRAGELIPERTLR